MSLYQAYCRKSDVPLQRRLEVMIDMEPTIDWPRAVADLQAAGFSFQKIMEVLGDDHCKSPATVHGWANGATPNYESGRRLLLVHHEVTEKPSPVKMPTVELTGAARLYRAASSPRSEQG